MVLFATRATVAVAAGDSSQLDPVLVEGGGSDAQIGDVVLSETTGAASVVQGEALQRAGASLPKLLAHETGLQIRESGGLGGFSSATLRGASSEQVLIYLDGLLLNASAGGGVNLSNIDLLQVEAVEVYRGVTPVQLHQASLGGAINLRTRRPGSDPSMRWLIGAGSFGTRQAELLADGRRGQWDGLVTLSWQQSDNDFPFRNDNGTRLNADDDFDDHRNNSAVEQSSLLLKLGHRGERIRDDASLQWFDKQQQIPDWKNAPHNRASLATQIGRMQLNRRIEALFDSAWNTRLNLDLSRNRETYDDRAGAIGLGKQYSRWRTDLTAVGNYWEHVGESRTFAATINFSDERYDAIDLRDIDPASRAKRRLVTAAVQESLFFHDDRLLVTPELRYQRLQDNFSVSGSGFSSELLEQRNSDYQISPRLGAKWHVNENISIAANVGRYQRIPSFFELFGDRGLFVGNPSLKPERGINTDLLFEWRATNITERVEALSLNLGFFYSDVSDAIGRVYDARGIGKSINIEGALIRGAEWALVATFANKLALHFRGTAQDAENRNAFPAFRGKKLPGQAALTTSLLLEYPLSRGRIYYQYLGKFDRWYDTANLLPAEDQTTHDIGLDWKFKQVKVAAELRNLNDDSYEDFNGFPKPGRSFFISITYTGGTNRGT